ncbi:unnamed protein product [Caenorhabditis brenneri]
MLVKVSDFTEQCLRVFPNCKNHLGQFCESLRLHRAMSESIPELQQPFGTILRELVKVSDFTEQCLRVFPNCNNHLGQFCESLRLHRAMSESIPELQQPFGTILRELVKVSDFTEQCLRVFPNCNNHLGQFCESLRFHRENSESVSKFLTEDVIFDVVDVKNFKTKSKTTKTALR